MKVIKTWFTKITPFKLVLLGILVGVGGAAGAIIFHFLIKEMAALFYGDFGEDFIGHLATIPIWLRVIVPTLGGLLIGLVFHLTKVKEAEGEGVPEVMDALTHHHAKIRPWVVPVKMLASAITLGSGGSAGREGPVIQIGSAIGSSVAQFFSLAEKERSLLLAAGAAAAIGGTFGAPLAGIVFTVEVFKHRPSAFRMLVIALAAAVGYFGTQAITGNSLVLNFSPTAELSWLWKIGLAVIIGILSASAALLFGVVLVQMRMLFHKISLPHILNPALGGFVIGIIGLFVPYIHEPAAYPMMIEIISLTKFSVGFLILLFFVKMIATGVTLGSGGVGGIFAPSLLLGTILGSVVGVVMVSAGWLSLEQVPLVIFMGMAAVFAAAVHAPFTAMFIIVELTSANELLIPLGIACLVAATLARIIKPKSIYDLHLNPKKYKF